MYSRARITQIIYTTPIILFQYVQVHALVGDSMRYCKVFRTLTAFELLLTSVESQRKLLSTLYEILLPVSSVDDKSEG